jgi:hypothetical protein
MFSGHVVLSNIRSMGLAFSHPVRLVRVQKQNGQLLIVLSHLPSTSQRNIQSRLLFMC